MQKLAMNLELYKILITVMVLLMFVGFSHIVEAVRTRRMDRMQASCVAIVLAFALVLGLLVWNTYAVRIA
jgi:hypothetical protein